MTFFCILDVRGPLLLGTDINPFDIILACRKSVLFYNNTTWEKTTTNNFYVTLGSFDSAQIADIVGIYILDTLSRHLNLNNIGIYKDDELIFKIKKN